jgi:hypothetical protein
MDIGDWQELSRLRYENHLWHRCIAQIVESIHPEPGQPRRLTVRESIEQSVAELNERLRHVGRRPVSAAR